MIAEKNLEENTWYIGRTGNFFILIAPYDPNTECFRQGNGQLHLGREFIEYRNGKRVIDLVKA